MKKDIDSELKKLLETSFPFAKEANAVKESIWNKIDLNRRKSNLWFRIAALLLLFFISAATIYLYISRDSATQLLVNQIDELKLNIRQNQGVISSYQHENEQLKLALIKNESLLVKDDLVNNNSEKIIIYQKDTIIIYRNAESKTITQIIYDTIYFEKEEPNLVSMHSNTSSPTSFQVHLNDNNRQPEKVRFGIRLKGLKSNKEVESQFGIFGIKL